MTKIYGASDDLIEIEGEITDEIGCYNNTCQSITVSDGTRARIHYDDEGQWRIEVLVSGPLFIKKIDSVGDDAKHTDDAANCSSYSDVLFLKEGVEWIKIGKRTFKK